MQNKSKLEVYLTGLGTFTALASSSSAAIVSINVSSVSAPNAGLAPGTQTTFLATWSADPDDNFGIANLATVGGAIETGLFGQGGSAIAANGGIADPRNFASGVVIDVAAAFAPNYYFSTFRDVYGGNTTTAPAWGAGSYMGFRDGDGHYGWLEMTWNPGTQTFQILSGAFESVPGVGIAAGAVPEPGALGLLAAGGVLAARRRRRLAA